MYALFDQVFKLENLLAALFRRTHKRRWAKVARQSRPCWDARNEIIAERIPAGSSVLDLGCGAQTLKGKLKKGCSYQPCDLIKSAPDVIVCDFNAGSYPELNRTFDYVISSGVLEYMRGPQSFIRKASSLGVNLIVSYNPTSDKHPRFERMKNGWINHLTEAELSALFDVLGLSALLLHRSQTGEVVYEVRSAPKPCRRLG